jgi:hypothetical protein
LKGKILKKRILTALSYIWIFQLLTYRMYRFFSTHHFFSEMQCNGASPAFITIYHSNLEETGFSAWKK